jgi:hypothetical protein
MRRFFARHRFLLRVETGLFWLLCAWGLYFLIGTFVVPPVAEAKLQKLCGGTVHIESGRFSGFNAIRLSGVMVADDSRKRLDVPILQADTVEIQFDTWQLFRGRFRVHTILLKDFLLTGDYDPAVKKWNIANLSFQKSESSGPAAFPLIVMQQGALRIRLTGRDGPEVLTTASLNGRIAEQTAKNEYVFSLETDGRFGYGKSSLLGGVRIGQTGAENQLWATGQIQMPASGVLQNRWDLRDIKLDCAFDKETVAVRQLSCRMADGRAAFDGRVHWKGDRPFDLNIDLENLTLSDQFVSNTIVYRRLNEFSDSGLTRFLDEYHPAGRGDMKLAIKGGLDDVSNATLDGVIHCTDISIYDDEFPYRLEKLQGDVLFTGRDLELKGLQAQHGDVRLEINGMLKNLGPTASIDIRTTSPNLCFDGDLKKALSEPVQKVWFEFSPSGLTGLDYHFQRASDGKENTTLKLNLDNAAAVYKHFPYPLENLTGQITVDSQGVLLENIKAHYDDSRRIQVDGKIFRLDDSDPGFHVSIQAERIPVDDRLIQAMPEKQQRLFDRLQAKALADLSVDVFPKVTDPRYLDYTAQIQIDAETFLHERFPLLMTDAKLTAMVTQDVVDVNDFQAQTACGPIYIGKSKVWPQGADPNQPGFCLNLDMKQFELNDLFWNAAGADANQLLGGLRGFGAVDASGLFVANSPAPEYRNNNLAIDFTDNPLRWSNAGVGTASGRVLLQNGVLSFSNFNLKDIPLELLPPDRMPPRIQILYSGVKPKGLGEVTIRKGFLKTGPEGLFQMDLDAGIGLRNVLFEKAAAIHELDGTCDGHFAADTQEGTWQTEVHYEISHLMYDRWILNNLRGDLNYDPTSMQLKSNDLKAIFYCADSPCQDDQVTGKLVVNLAAETQANYELELNYQKVDLQQLIAATRQVTPEESVNGLAAGNLVLLGQFNDLSQPRGKFTAGIRDMKMGQQSLLGKVLTAVQLRRPENFVFSEIELAADIRASELIFDRVRMVGNPLVFHGSGTVDLKSRQITMELASWDRVLRGEDTVLDMLVRGIGSALWKVEIYGDLDSPEVQAVFLSVLKQPLDVFRKNNAGPPAKEAR